MEVSRFTEYCNCQDEQTQREWVINELNKHGEVSRNDALANYISRLSDIIFKLKKQGWEFDTERRYYGNSKKFNFVYVRKEQV
jgi:hypothetical protein